MLGPSRPEVVLSDFSLLTVSGSTNPNLKTVGSLWPFDIAARMKVVTLKLECVFGKSLVLPDSKWLLQSPRHVLPKIDVPASGQPLGGAGMGR